MIAIEAFLMGCCLCIVVGIIIHIISTTKISFKKRPDAMEEIHKTTWE